MNFKELSLSFLTGKLLPAVIILVIGVIIIKIIIKLEHKLMAKITRVDPMLHKFISSATKIVLWVILLLEVFKKLGVDSSSLITVFAAAGAAIALGLQGSLSNLAGGILIMVTKPFLHGEYIACNGVEGVVQSTDLLHTTIQTVDGKTVTLPNSALSGGTITNFSRLGIRRVDVDIDVAYESDLELAKKTVLALSDEYPKFLDSQPKTCNISNYGDSGITLNFRGWVNQADYWDAYFFMNNNLKPRLDAASIEIPFPQVDVHQK